MERQIIYNRRKHDTYNRTIVAVTAIIALATLEGIALCSGTDGILFSITSAVIGGIAGGTFRASRWLSKILVLALTLPLVSCASHTTVWRSEAPDGTLDTVEIRGTALPGGKGEQQADAEIIVDASGGWQVRLGSAATEQVEQISIPADLLGAMLRGIKTVP